MGASAHEYHGHPARVPEIMGETPMLLGPPTQNRAFVDPLTGQMPVLLDLAGWQRQAESSELADGLPIRHRQGLRKVCGLVVLHIFEPIVAERPIAMES